MPNVAYGETPKLYTITVTTQDTEYSQAFPNPVKAIRFQCRDATDVRFAFEAGKVAGSTEPFHTLKSGQVYAKDMLYANKLTLYVACASGTKKVEVLVWE